MTQGRDKQGWTGSLVQRDKSQWAATLLGWSDASVFIVLPFC